jgi:hypothetical protein
MTSRAEPKRWQFGLRSLLLLTTLSPIIIGLAGGAFGDTIQRAFLFVLAIFLWIIFLMLSAGGLMFVIAMGAYYFARLVERNSRD